VSHPPVGRLAPSVPAGKALVGSPGAAADRQWQTTENAPNEPGAKESTTMTVVTMRQLLESGVHFGHQTRRWNPKMKRFIFTDRNGIYIIDLQQSLSYIDRAYDFVRETVAHGGSVLFVGTKKQAQEAVREQATRVGMPYVTERWLGGMLTNFQTVHARLQRLKELEEIDFDDVAGSGMTKKELLRLRREKEKLETTLGGIRDMQKLPSAIWVVDTNKEHLAVAEARKLGIPVIAILDTNCDPDEVGYPIPGNDDAIRAVQLLTRVLADAVADGLRLRAERAGGGDTSVAGDEPLAEWEQELLGGEPASTAAATDPASVSTEAAAAEATSPASEDAEAVVAPAAEPATEAAAEPATEAAAEPATEAAAEPATEPAAEPATEAAAEPAAEPATEAAAEPATEPAPEVVESADAAS
jgi:small subunit ribosomal protein S2